MYDSIVAVTENRPLTGGHFLLSLYSPRQAQAARPGQFVMVQLLNRSDVLLRRPMSIYNVKPAEGHRRKGRGVVSSEVVQVLYKVVGRGTRLMSELKPGDSVGLLGPLGHGFLEEDYLPQVKAADEILHVAGGIGIAALLLAAKQLARAGLRQRLFFGGRTTADLVGLEEFEPLVNGIGLATEDGSRGRHGFVTRPLEEYFTRHRKKKFLLMACGPGAMLKATVELAKQYGHPCLVSLENRMGCGLGACLGCSIQVHGEGHGTYERVCTEGPVFWADRVVWDK